MFVLWGRAADLSDLDATDVVNLTLSAQTRLIYSECCTAVFAKAAIRGGMPTNSITFSYTSFFV